PLRHVLQRPEQLHRRSLPLLPGQLPQQAALLHQLQQQVGHLQQKVVGRPARVAVGVLQVQAAVLLRVKPLVLLTPTLTPAPRRPNRPPTTSPTTTPSPPPRSWSPGNEGRGPSMPAPRCPRSPGRSPRGSPARLSRACPPPPPPPDRAPAAPGSPATTPASA